MGFLAGSIMLLVAVPFVIIALVFLFMGLNARRRASIAKTWPQTVGQVLASGVESRRSSRSTAYYLKVVYTYQVNGQQLTSDRVTLGAPIGLGNYRAMEKRAAAYPPGNSVMVYYNPDNPAEAVLETSAPSGTIFIIIAIIIILILVVTNFFIMGIMNNFFGGLF